MKRGVRASSNLWPMSIDASSDLQIHSETELGDNESIKDPKPMESSRSARKKQTYVVMHSTLAAHNVI
jgi:hypothetical protein